jgi:hypothetical protein
MYLDFFSIKKIFIILIKSYSCVILSIPFKQNNEIISILQNILRLKLIKTHLNLNTSKNIN